MAYIFTRIRPSVFCGTITEPALPVANFPRSLGGYSTKAQFTQIRISFTCKRPIFLHEYGLRAHQVSESDTETTSFWKRFRVVYGRIHTNPDWKICGFKSVRIRVVEVKVLRWCDKRWFETWCYTGRFATTIFSTTQRCNVGTMLQSFETMLQRCVALKVVVVNRLV